MSKVVVSFEFANAAEALAFITRNAGNAPAAVTQTAAPQAPTAATGIAPPPPPSAPATAPQAAPASPPPPPPAASAPPPPPPAAAGGVTQQTVLAAMQAYSQTHKAAGVKAVLAKCGLTGIGNANPQQLEWLQQAFASMAAPESF